MNNPFNSSKNTQKIDMAILLLLKANYSAIEILDDHETLPAFGNIEAFIFNTYLSKIMLKKINQSLYNEIHKDYEISIIETLKTSGITSYVPDLLDFVNTRISFYMDELEGMQMNESWLASRIYYVFYESPLTNNPKPSMNIPNVMTFQFAFMGMMTSVKKAVEIIDNQTK